MEDLKQKVNSWLNDPIGEGVLTSEELLKEIQINIDHNPQNRETLGPLIGKIKATQKKIDNIEPIHWVNVLNGKIAIGHRPGKKMISDLYLQGADCILTLLSESEGALEVKKLVTQENMRWLYYPMSSARPPSQNEITVIKDLFNEMKELLSDEKKVYMHCSAGIHRTGMITNAFLRYIGIDKESALKMLLNLRNETGINVGDERIQWAEQFIK
jgi:protein-tyrosine phosphatase